MYTHPLYETWRSQKRRCSEVTHEAYSRYGALGITFDTVFLDFDFWLKYVKALPNFKKSNYTIDRIDNNRGYEPGNLRWASKSIQARNTKKIIKSNTSGYRGVSKLGKKWRAQIYINNKAVYLGSYNTKEEAAMVYDTYIVVNELEHTINNILIKMNL